MSIANVKMFEFEDEEALKTFANWYSGNGANVFITKTAPSSGCGPHTPTIFGRSTLCTISLAMGAAIKCSQF